MRPILLSSGLVPLAAILAASLSNSGCHVTTATGDGGSGSDTGTPEAGATCRPEAGMAQWDTQAVRIDGTGMDTNRKARLGFDGSGNAIAVWEQQSNSTNGWSVWAAQRDTSGTWSAAKQIDGAPMGDTQLEPLPALAVSANGSAVVVFQEHTSDMGNGASNAAYAVYTPGSGWAPAGQFTPPTKPDQVNDNEVPQVAIDSKGNAMAVWVQDMAGAGDAGASAAFGPQVYAARLTAGQGWSMPVLLSNEPLYGFTATARVGVDEKGDAVAAWTAEPGNSPIRAMAAHYDGASNQWSAATFIDQCTACMSNIGVVPSVGLDSSGNAEVVWTQGQTGGQIAVFAARYGAQAGTWDSAQQLDTGLMTNLNASAARVVVDTMGNATAAWVNISNDKTHPNTIITARMVGSGWTPATPVDITMPGVDTRPDIAVDDQGDVMVAWDSQETLWATELPAGAMSWPTDTQIDPQDNSANDPSVAFMHGCPNAMIAFDNTNSSGGGTGIYVLSFR